MRPFGPPQPYHGYPPGAYAPPAYAGEALPPRGGVGGSSSGVGGRFVWANTGAPAAPTADAGAGAPAAAAAPETRQPAQSAAVQADQVPDGPSDRSRRRGTSAKKKASSSRPVAERDRDRDRRGKSSRKSKDKGKDRAAASPSSSSSSLARIAALERELREAKDRCRSLEREAEHAAGTTAALTDRLDSAHRLIRDLTDSAEADRSRPQAPQQRDHDRDPVPRLPDCLTFAQVEAACDFEVVLGEGGFGRVYQGNHRQYGAIAVKRRHSSGQHGTQGDREFVRELLVLAGVRHKHVVPLYAVCLDTPCLVYALMDRGTLRSQLEAGASGPARLRFALGISLGLGHLHDLGHVHCDIKSDNVLVDSLGHARIADVGLAHQLGDAPGRSHVSLRERMVGTLGYVDPAYAATGHMRRESDVYSAGVVFLEILTNLPALVRDGGGPPTALAMEARRIVAGRGVGFLARRGHSSLPERGAHALAEAAASMISEDPRSRPTMSRVAALVGAVAPTDTSDVPPPRKRECVVCLAHVDACLVPCRHASTCASCARLLIERGDSCPICRRPIESMLEGDFPHTYAPR